MTFAADLALANPKVYVDPRLYEVAESEAFPVANRRVDQTLFFLRFMQVNDAKLIRYGHDTSSNGPDATVLNLASSTTVGSAVPYDIDTPGITYQLSQLSGRVTISNFTENTLNPDVNQVEFQLAAKAHAIRALFGQRFITGNGAGGNFFGLSAICSPTGLGLGQTVIVGTTVTLTNPLDYFDYAIALIRSGDRNFREIAIFGNSEAYRKIISLARANNSEPAVSFEYCAALGFKTLHYNSIPFAINDHIGTVEGSTDLYFVDLREIKGMVHRHYPDIVRTKVQASDSVQESYIVSWYVGLVCLNGLGIVKLENFDVNIS